MLFRRPDNPPKSTFSVEDLDPSNTWLLGPARVTPSLQTASRSVQFFAGLTIVTNRQTQTDRPIGRQTTLLPSVAIGRIYAVHAA